MEGLGAGGEKGVGAEVSAGVVAEEVVGEEGGVVDLGGVEGWDDGGGGEVVEGFKKLGGGGGNVFLCDFGKGGDGAAMDEEGVEKAFAAAGLQGEGGEVLEGGEVGVRIGVSGVEELAAGDAVFDLGGAFEFEAAGGFAHQGFLVAEPAVAGGFVGKEVPGGGDLGVIPGHRDGAVAGGGAFAHFLVGAGAAAGGELQGGVFAAEVEQVFEGVDESGGGGAVANGPGIEGVCVADGLGGAQAGEGVGRIDGDPPGGAEGEELVVGVGVEEASGLEVEMVGGEGGVDDLELNAGAEAVVGDAAGGVGSGGGFWWAIGGGSRRFGSSVFGAVTGRGVGGGCVEFGVVGIVEAAFERGAEVADGGKEEGGIGLGGGGGFVATGEEVDGGLGRDFFPVHAGIEGSGGAVDGGGVGEEDGEIGGHGTVRVGRSSWLHPIGLAGGFHPAAGCAQL